MFDGFHDLVNHVIDFFVFEGFVWILKDHTDGIGLFVFSDFFFMLIDIKQIDGLEHLLALLFYNAFYLGEGNALV